jgi:hypothetical protein
MSLELFLSLLLVGCVFIAILFEEISTKKFDEKLRRYNESRMRHPGSPTSLLPPPGGSGYLSRGRSAPSGQKEPRTEQPALVRLAVSGQLGGSGGGDAWHAKMYGPVRPEWSLDQGERLIVGLAGNRYTLNNRLPDVKPDPDAAQWSYDKPPAKPGRLDRNRPPAARTKISER